MDTADAVEYSAEDYASGNAVSLADLRGAPVLLAGWSLWCVPCRKELPALQALHEDRGDDGLQVVLVNLDAPGSDVSAIDEMARKSGLTMPQWSDPDDVYSRTFRTFGLPASVLLDAKGQVVHRWLGVLDPGDAEVRHLISETLDQAEEDRS